MKRAITVFLVLAMFGCLAGCSNSADQEEVEELKAVEEDVIEEVEEETEEEEDTGTGNIFIDELMPYYTTNSSGSSISIGVVILSKDEAKAAGKTDLAEFALGEMQNHSYAWTTIWFPDGTGIVFTSNSAYAAQYGSVDSTYALNEAYGNLFLDEESMTYTYERF